MRVLILMVLLAISTTSLASERCKFPEFFSVSSDRCLPAADGEDPLAAEKPMSFVMRQVGIRPELTWIAAEGEITKETPDEFSRFLEDNVVYKENRIEFHSTGGNLYAAMELGRRIREAGLSTTVGRSIRLENKDFILDVFNYDNALCLSACAYAFLGGEKRWISDDVSLGVHRFGSREFDVSGDQAQAASSDIAHFLEQMDVDQRLFQIASRVDFETEIFFLEQTLAQKLRVTFDPSLRDSLFQVELLNDHIVANAKLFHKGLEYNLRVHCIDNFPRIVIWGRTENFPDIFRDLPRGVASVLSNDEEIFTRVTAGALSDGNSFLTLDAQDIIRPLIINRDLTMNMIWPPNWNELKTFDRITWLEKATWFSWRFSPENPKDALEIVLRQC